MLPTLVADPFLELENGAVEIALIRHGHAVPGEREIVPGDYDQQPLSERGQRQARAMAERFRRSPVAAIYSSPILRVRQTAQHVADVCALPVAVEADLREVDLSGLRAHLPPATTSTDPVVQLQAYLRQVEAVATQIGVWSQIPGAESSVSVRTRMLGALDRIAARHAGQRVAVVSHDAAINTAIAAIMGLGRDFFYPVANTSISTLRIQGDQRLVVAINDHAHLAQLQDQGEAFEASPDKGAPRRFWIFGRKVASR
jgi:2,3-bisphosphoglycerate-dependent phosphoglycerate mutase